MKLTSCCDVVWVGGMFFAYCRIGVQRCTVCSHPTTAPVDKVFSKFFHWVWLAGILVLVSGFYMIICLAGSPIYRSISISC